MPATNRPLGASSSRTHWDAPKRCRSLSLTDEAWERLTMLATFQGLNRSETMERLIRKATELTD